MEQINLEKVYDAVSAFTGWLWGIPILIVLIGGGVFVLAAVAIITTI